MLFHDVQDYLNRSGDSEIENGNLEQNENGFCIWEIHKDKLILIQVYGNGVYWNEWAEKKGKELGLKKIVFATKRNPEGFMRKHKFNIAGYVLEREI